LAQKDAKNCHFQGFHLDSKLNEGKKIVQDLKLLSKPIKSNFEEIEVTGRIFY